MLQEHLAQGLSEGALGRCQGTRRIAARHRPGSVQVIALHSGHVILSEGPKVIEGRDLGD